MNAFLRNSLLLSALTVMALPPGWCCGLWLQRTAEAAPANGHCCGHAATQRTKEEAPAAPQAECCCLHETAVPPQTVELADGPTVALHVPFDQADRPRDALCGRSSAFLILDSGPKLHVLQCVWRC